MTIDQNSITKNEAVKIAVTFGQKNGLLSFNLSEVRERSCGDESEWIVYLHFEENDEFEDDHNFAIVVVNKATGVPRLVETL